MREVHRLQNLMHTSKFAISLLFKFCSFAKFYSHTTSCAPCAKAKAACKPFDADRARAKVRVEAVWRSQARKTKQQIDVEWKAEVSRKLEGLSELQGLRKDVRRIADTLERIAGMRSMTPENDIISWPESGGEETETLERIDKGKGREIVEGECDNEWSEMDIEVGGDEMEGVEDKIGTPVLSVQSNRVDKS